MKSKKPRIGISIGDLNGIGPEVILKTFRDKRMLEHCIPVIYGSSKSLAYHKKVLGMDDFKYFVVEDTDSVRDKNVNVVNCWTNEVPIKLGEPSKETGLHALRALEGVAYDAKEGKIDAVVTAPINKSTVKNDDNNFIGQTEFFQEKCGEKASMMLMTSNDVRIGLVTNHVPVSQITQAINQEIILKKLDILSESLQMDFLIGQPKIAVLALNPHAGDEGLIGEEDDLIVKPAVLEAKNQGHMVFGPFAADGFFGTGLYRQFDGILAMYHDQGLVPFKLLSFGHGVNCTVGLPLVRTSPDHGTAYDIVGKNEASEDSFRQAIFTAIDILKNRENYLEMKANKLDPSKFNKEQVS